MACTAKSTIRLISQYVSLVLLLAFVATWLGCDTTAETATRPATGNSQATGGTSTGKVAAATSEQAAVDTATAVEAATASPEKPSRIVDKTFDDIKFEIEPDAKFSRGMLTAEIEALAGQRIRIRGYILPTPQKRGIKQFVLVRDNQECCFGPGAALYDCILVEMEEGKTAEFSIRPVAVEGEFDIREFVGPDGRHLAIYHLGGEVVK